MGILDGSVARMAQSAIKDNEELERLMNMPENKLLADEINRIRSENERFIEKLRSIRSSSRI